MNTIKKYFALLSVVIFLSASAVVAGPAVSDAKPEKTIEQQIFKRIASLPRYGVFDLINFEVQGDTVILSGKTITLGTKRAAANAVKDLPGIRNVVNNIEELPPSGYDNSIRRGILREFADKGLYQYLWEPNPSVHIIVDRGRVSLEGYVNNRSDANLMNILANGVPGTMKVENNLIVGKDSRR